MVEQISNRRLVRKSSRKKNVKGHLEAFPQAYLCNRNASVGVNVKLLEFSVRILFIYYENYVKA